VAAGSRAGGYDTVFEAARHMARLKDELYQPIPANPGSAIFLPGL